MLFLSADHSLIACEELFRGTLRQTAVYPREVVRRVQTMRKDADFNIDDRISVRYAASEKLVKAISSHAEYISGETLCDALETGDMEGYRSEDFTFDGETLTLGIKRN